MLGRSKSYDYNIFAEPQPEQIRLHVKQTKLKTNLSNQQKFKK